ncbi:MAG: rhodanese-like domain-containing protein [Nitrospirota bacterium]
MKRRMISAIFLCVFIFLASSSVAWTDILEWKQMSFEVLETVPDVDSSSDIRKFFASPLVCSGCHQHHFEEWSESYHAWVISSYSEEKSTAFKPFETKKEIFQVQLAGNVGEEVQVFARIYSYHGLPTKFGKPPAGELVLQMSEKAKLREGGSYWNMDVHELRDVLRNKDFLFINVHTPYEGEIEQTDLFIPYNQIEQNLDKLPADKDAKIILYCRTDRMSVIAAEVLVKKGYTNVWNLKGGMIEWVRAGYPLLDKRR